MTQFRHMQEERRTFALDVPGRDLFEEAAATIVAGAEAILSIGIGVARVHPVDRYCKAEGRKHAEKRLKVRNCRLVSFLAREEGLFFVLRCRRFDLELRLSPGAPRPIIEWIVERS